MTRPGLIRWVGAALCLGLSLAGCGSSAGPPISSDDPSAQLAEQRRSADEFLLCLADFSVPASLRDLGPAGDSVVWEPTDSVVARDRDGQELVYNVPGGQELDDQALAAAWATGQTTEDGTVVVLVIDGVDHSAAYAACLDASGYHLPMAVADPVILSDEAQAVLDQSNQWAACARANGWPDVADVTPVDGGLSEVVIPIRVDEAGLRALMAACPAYDAAGYAVAAEAWARGETDYPAPVFPYLTIAVPEAGGDWTERNHLLDLLNQLQSEAYAAAVAAVEGGG
ncbi:MAG: hypothetical protein LBJ44_01315 [Propionibacteriaceae bacterium]|jgi:hypothetical protein|nr:hypothetical protein [Propionibacteriaceae bacterium]